MMAPGATFVSIVEMTKIKHCNATPLISCNVADYGYELNAQLFFCVPISQLGFSAFVMMQSVLLVKSVIAIYMSNNLRSLRQTARKGTALKKVKGQMEAAPLTQGPLFLEHGSHDWEVQVKQLFNGGLLVNNPLTS